MKSQQLQTALETVSQVIESANQTENKSVFVTQAVNNLSSAKVNLEKEKRRVNKLKKDMN